MITSSSEDLTTIKSTQYLINWVQSMMSAEDTIHPGYVSIPDCKLSEDQILDLQSHYNSVYNILTTSGMSYQDYQSSIENLD
jgi:hypothetical protein